METGTRLTSPQLQPVFHPPLKNERFLGKSGVFSIISQEGSANHVKPHSPDLGKQIAEFGSMENTLGWKTPLI